MDAQIIDAGYYTPTLTNTTNLDDSTSSEFMWVRVGDHVVVAGRVDVDPTAAAPTATALTMSVPLPTANFTSGNDANGTINAPLITSESGAIAANVGAQTVVANFSALSTANHTMRCIFMYRIRQ